jgi:hypothetical protein
VVGKVNCRMFLTDDVLDRARGPGWEDSLLLGSMIQCHKVFCSLLMHETSGEQTSELRLISDAD